LEVDSALVEVVIEKAEGNPFFLEELARARRENVKAEDVGPETVQDVLWLGWTDCLRHPARSFRSPQCWGANSPGIFSSRLSSLSLNPAGVPRSAPTHGGGRALMHPCREGGRRRRLAPRRIGF